jgi:lysophospholipid acyltransferase (LPLAT)-like uncharacterized protein
MAACEEHRTAVSTEKLDYTSPRAFSTKQRFLLATVPPLAAGILKTVDSTCRHVVRGEEHWDTVSGSGAPFLAGFWHENLSLFLSVQRDTGFHTLTSYSFDGEMAARAVTQFGMKALRGSSSQGGMKALAQMAVAIRQVQMVGFTVDGPKGPRRRAKPGLAILAAKTQHPILPMAATATRCYRMGSWDRLVLPFFFSVVAIGYGAPIPPPLDKTKKSILATTEALETSMNTLQSELEEEFGVDPLLADGMAP